MPVEVKPQTSVKTIYLASSDHAQDFQTGNLVHQDEFDATIGFIRDALKRAEANPDREYLHDTITLLGSRGSGKTSFLLSVAKWVREDDSRNGRDGDLSRIQVLDIVDPTLIEEKGHVFLNVISLIQNLVDKKLDQRECNPGQSESARFSRKEWRSSLNTLAAGLPSIDGVGSPATEGWQDPEFVMDIGLKTVGASQKLSKNFNEFLRISLAILEKKAFLLIFDDIDVDASKGWVVLETIRKYFTGARLISLISGDLELYTTVVRQKKWKNFGNELVKYEGELTEGRKGLKDYNRLVTKLTAQYMLKIMQPQFRVHLNTLLHRKLTREKLDIDVAYNTDQNASKPEDIESVYGKIFARYGILNGVQREVFNTYMLDQPLRSQIQFLLLMMTKNAEPAESETFKPIDNDALADIFLSDLLDLRVDISIGAGAPKYLVIVILKFLLSQQKLEDLYQLQPTTTNESLNAVLFTLNLMLSNTISNGSRFAIFEYLIKIGYLKNLMTVISYRRTDVSNDGPHANIEDLCEHSGALNDGILRDVTGKILAYLHGALEQDNLTDINPYFCQLKALQNSRQHALNDRIDAVFGSESTSKAEKMLGYIPCFAGAYGYKNESRIAYSFYLLLGAVGEIVKQYETILVEVEEKRQPLVLKRMLKELSQLRSYPIIAFSKKRTEILAREPVVPSQDSTDTDKLSDVSDDLLCQIILQWLKSDGSSILASHQLGKIATRFFYAMNNIAESSPKNITLGEIFHRQVVAFLNAVLIEDVRENMEDEIARININNTNTNDQVLINNLSSLIGPRGLFRSSRLKFSKWILSCPLLLAYLKNGQRSRLRGLLWTYSSGQASGQENHVFSVSELLDKIAFRLQEDGEGASEYPIIEGSPVMLKKPDALVHLLKSNNIPFEWFYPGQDRGETRRRYNLIRKYISSVFLDDNRTAGRIRKFKTYLDQNGIK